MSVDVRTLTRYHHDLWHRFADFYVERCTWEELSLNHETSHISIANVTMHAVNMEDWWLHYRVPGKPWSGPKWDGFRNAVTMRERVLDVAQKTESLLSIATPEDLARKRTIDSEGVKGEWSLEEILAEVVNEASHHRGEVLAMLWRMDKEPPYLSYTDWVASQAR